MAPFGARRHTRAEYEELKEEIIERLECEIPSEFVEIPFYRSKSSFGDLDLLTFPLEEDYYDKILEVLDVKHWIRNRGNDVTKRSTEVMSLLYKELQVDIIPMPKEDFSTAYSYYAYNDLGNLLGKLFHKMGLKYGHRGLTLPMKDGDNQFDEIVVSKNTNEIHKFLGLSDRSWAMGFETLEEIYDFVISSSYFDKTAYQYENLNHANRIRDRKRTTYHGFLEYIEDKPSKYTFNEDKVGYLTNIFATWPVAIRPYHEAIAKLEKQKQVKEHFNGHKVSEWTGLRGLYLKKFMMSWKWTNGEDNAWTLNLSEEKLKQLVIEHYNEFVRAERKHTLDFNLKEITWNS